MPETLYHQIINAPLDYMGDITIRPAQEGGFTVEAFHTKWSQRAWNADRDRVNEFVETSRLLPPPYGTFPGIWRYRRIRPDDYVFKNWISIYYHALTHQDQKYSIEELWTFGRIVGITDISYDIGILSRALDGFCKEESRSPRQFDIYDYLIGAIRDYQDEQAKKGNRHE